MFDGFELDHVNAGEVTLRVRYGGEGEPVMLLDGHPRLGQTDLGWGIEAYQRRMEGVGRPGAGR